MKNNIIPKYAIVREVAATYDNCIKSETQKQEIKLESAVEQHKAYCSILETSGLKLIRLTADGRFPDCCFVEDTAIVFGDKAVISRIGAAPRKGETTAVKKALSARKKIIEIRAPGTIDGGDVLTIGRRVYAGLSGRTNLSGIRQLKSLLSYDGYTITPVEIKNTLHLKTVCTYIGNNCIVIAPGHFDAKVFSEYDIIRVPASESYSANCLAMNGRVIMPSGFPATKRLIEKKGFRTVHTGMSEFMKGNGGLTCLSILFD